MTVEFKLHADIYFIQYCIFYMKKENESINLTKLRLHTCTTLISFYLLIFLKEQ